MGLIQDNIHIAAEPESNCNRGQFTSKPKCGGEISPNSYKQDKLNSKVATFSKEENERSQLTRE